VDAVCELTAVKIVGLLHAVDNPHTHVILGPMQGVDITPFRAMQNRLRKTVEHPSSVCLSVPSFDSSYGVWRECYCAPCWQEISTDSGVKQQIRAVSY